MSHRLGTIYGISPPDLWLLVSKISPTMSAVEGVPEGELSPPENRGRSQGSDYRYLNGGIQAWEQNRLQTCTCVHSEWHLSHKSHNLRSIIYLQWLQFNSKPELLPESYPLRSTDWQTGKKKDWGWGRNVRMSQMSLLACTASEAVGVIMFRLLWALCTACSC